PGRSLVVGSGGSELQRLEALAAGAPNIRFTGWCDEAALQDLLGRCRAVVYVPRDEDFGISAVEAMAAGKPVLGVAEGGLLETVVHGQSGWLMAPDEHPETLMEGVRQLEALNPPSLRTACETRAGQFDEAIFVQRMQALLAP
ncbi:MAG: glycosyltransferase, partial [Limnohabitans sp.]